MEKIDTHQHLLYPENFSYSWTDELPALQKGFHIEDYDKAAASSNVTHTLFMEVDVNEGQSEQEAHFFCRLADDASSRLCGVIASCRPENNGFDAYLDRIAHDRLRGLRRILHTQPDALMENSLLRRNIAGLHRHGLTFDLCVLQRQLGLAANLVKACPKTQFIMDHCGVPDIAGNGYKDWLPKIKEMAKHENVACKISGIVAYTSPETLNVSSMRPYVEGIIEAFGWDQIVWGSDWPVCNLNADLPTWSSILDEILSGTTTEERAKLFSINARRIYQIH